LIESEKMLLLKFGIVCQPHQKTISSNYFFYIGDQFIEPYGFSGSLPLLFAMLFAIFVLTAENKLFVGCWLLVYESLNVLLRVLTCPDM